MPTDEHDPREQPVQRDKPWDRPNPKKTEGKKSRKLTAAQVALARLMAREAGRPYPNLVDNMRAAAATKKAKTAKTAKTAKKAKIPKTAAKTRAAKKPPR